MKGNQQLAVSDKPIKTVPDASNIPAIQQMLRHAYDWGVQKGYITFDGDGQPVFAVPVRKDEGERMKDEAAKVKA